MIPAPEPSLKVSVVVPAKDEEALIPRCLRSLAEQEGVRPDEYEVLLVLDRCADATGERALRAASEHPSLRLALLEGPGLGAGHARRVGMEAACERLIGLGRPGGLIASTDADTVVAEDWLANQLAAAESGARAIGGRIELMEEEGPPDEVRSWRERRGEARHLGLLERDEDIGRRVEHWQFSGASLSLTAEAYEEIGGLEPRAALEDEYLEHALQQRNIPIERPLDVRVSTSPRLIGRASRGLARDLSLASWLRSNTYRKVRDAVELTPAQEELVSVVAPSQESPRARPGTREATGPRLVRVSTSGKEAPLSEEFGAVLGRGDALWRGLYASEGELVVLLPDDSEASLKAIPSLLAPLMEREDLALVKGYPADRSLPELSRLVGTPLINLYRPELSGLVDPLSGFVAARRWLLEALHFPVGAGVDASLVLDAASSLGAGAVAQVALADAGSVGDLSRTEASYAVISAFLSRAPEAPRDASSPATLVTPSPQEMDFDSRRIHTEERPPLSGPESVLREGWAAADRAFSS